MISAGTVNALVAWASGDTTRIAQLTAERDALVTAFLTNGQAASTMTSASANGKSFSFMVGLSREDKLSLITNVLVQLGAIDASVLPPTVTYGNFAGIKR